MTHVDYAALFIACFAGASLARLAWRRIARTTGERRTLRQRIEALREDG